MGIEKFGVGWVGPVVDVVRTPSPERPAFSADGTPGPGSRQLRRSHAPPGERHVSSALERLHASQFGVHLRGIKRVTSPVLFSVTT